MIRRLSDSSLLTNEKWQMLPNRVICPVFSSFQNYISFLDNCSRVFETVVYTNGILRAVHRRRHYLKRFSKFAPLLH